jgi:hypothetical protein
MVVQVVMGGSALSARGCSYSTPTTWLQHTAQTHQTGFTPTPLRGRAELVVGFYVVVCFSALRTAALAAARRANVCTGLRANQYSRPARPRG